jgi:hypothetical protein
MSFATAMLVFPADADLRALSQKRVPLTFTTEHRLTRNRRPVLVDGDGEVLTWEAFRGLRVKLGAWIETDNPAAVCEALALPPDEPGIIVVAPSGPSRGELPPSRRGVRP